MKKAENGLLLCVAITCLYAGDCIGQYRSRPPVITVPVTVRQPDLNLQVFHPDTKAAVLPAALSNGERVALK